jgi:MFS family permease
VAPIVTAPARRGSRFREIFSRDMVVVVIAATAAVMVLGGTEVAVVALLRSHDQSELSALVFIIWSAASAVGGLLLGAMRRQVSVFWLLLGLGVLAIPAGLVPSGSWLLLAIIPTGFFCAPSLAATAAEVSRLVPEEIRGEAMGWYGAATTAGMSLGAPLAGFAIDHVGPWAGFALIGTIGALVAVIGLVLVPWRIDRPGPTGSGATSGVSPTRRLQSEAESAG